MPGVAFQFLLGYFHIMSSTKLAVSKMYSAFGLSWSLVLPRLPSPKSKWRGRRKLLTPAFHFKLLDDFVPVMADHSRAFVGKLRALSRDNAVLDVVPLVSSCTLDVICGGLTILSC
ncbi:hypothetical protein HPB48_002804 [Haemaphysalis longicornis]|uniref:Uncharacterized protein n=1 Tax=Haemaphysalis longicornis TaxID=44386 RepID=A0A9J6GQD6_HAELO|nr:hypothetical protein HPB48_002804 [Haemaphysalis longicornis]